MSDRLFDDFLRDCGAIGPLVLHVERAGDVLPVTLRRPFALVSGDTNADIVLEEPSARGRCAYLQVLAGRLFCIDLQTYPQLQQADRTRRVWMEQGQALP